MFRYPTVSSVIRDDTYLILVLFSSFICIISILTVILTQYYEHLNLLLAYYILIMVFLSTF